MTWGGAWGGSWVGPWYGGGDPNALSGTAAIKITAVGTLSSALTGFVAGTASLRVEITGSIWSGVLPDMPRTARIGRLIADPTLAELIGLPELAPDDLARLGSTAAWSQELDSVIDSEPARLGAGQAVVPETKHIVPHRPRAFVARSARGRIG